MRICTRMVVVACLAVSVGWASPAVAAGNKVRKAPTTQRSARRAFRSLLRHRTVRTLYRTQREVHKVGGSVKSGLLASALVPMMTTYAGGFAYGTSQGVEALSGALQRGNAAEIAFTAAFTTLLTAATVGNVWLTKASFKSAARSFKEAKAQRKKAQRATIQALLSDSNLQRQINGGKPLTDKDRAYLSSVAGAL